jgi:iron complex transport system substrate-binding protein
MNMTEKILKKLYIFLFIAIALTICLPCIVLGESGGLFPDMVNPEFAKGFSVEYHDTYKVIHIHDPWGRDTENYTYLLVQRGEEVPAGYPNAKVFFIPLENVVTLGAVQIPFISKLGEIATITGHNGVNLVQDPEFIQLVQKGDIIEIGSGELSMGTMLKMEDLIELEPDAVFCVANGNKEYDNHYKLQEAGLKPVISAEWMEDSPLGRAEWIKFFSLFYNKEKTANQVFDQVKKNYLETKEIVQNISKKPTIFSGIDYQGSWYAPGGSSYVAAFFRDAGGNYLLGDGNDRGDKTLDFESVYDKAQAADYWINIGYADNIDELLALDQRYQKFKAFQENRNYHYNARVNEYGGNDYWQSGIISPDVVLADLVKILQPDLLSDHDLYYYQHINAT